VNTSIQATAAVRHVSQSPRNADPSAHCRNAD
jgi:hypothetical protein